MSQKFEDYCPKIVPGELGFSGERLLFTSREGKQVILDPNARIILDNCDGENSVRAIATKMLRERKSLSFRLLIETLDLFKEASLLENLDDWPEVKRKTAAATKRPWWQRQVFQINLLKNGASQKTSPALFALVVLVLSVCRPILS